jgi:BASS family bile acid:Na+ symporter
MRELIADILRIATPVSVAIIVFAQGLRIAPRDIASYFEKRWGLLLRSTFAALVVAPLAALGLVVLLAPARNVAVGLAILMSCPPAPLMIKAAPTLGRGAGAFVASVHLCLALLAFVTVPAVLYGMSIPLRFSAEVDFAAMAWILGRTILLPIGLGLAVRGLRPRIADRIGPLLGRVGTGALAVLVLLVVVGAYPALRAMDPWSYFVIVLVSASTLAIGHILGPADPREKTVLAVECGVRHPALALTTGAAAFGADAAFPVLAPSLLTFVVVASAYLFWRGRAERRREPVTIDGRLLE